MPTSHPAALHWKRNYIETLGAKLAEGINYLDNFDVRGAVTKLGGRVAEKEFWFQLKGDGALVVNGPADFEIFVPPHEPDARRRFTIAHELGHYILHYVAAPERETIPLPMQASRYGDGPEEWEANWFAAGFLMPEALFKKQFEITKDIEELATHFHVSIWDVEGRIEYLKLK